MSKTFKSKYDGRVLNVRADSWDPLVWIEVNDAAGNKKTFSLNNDTAPDLALAILEEAQNKPIPHSDADFGSQEQIEYLTYGLKKHVEAEAKATAEAKDREQLEAEALALFNACRSVSGMSAVMDWSEATINKDIWIAVATEARTLLLETDDE